MKYIYKCNSCKYIFEYEGECDSCPDCGKKDIVLAGDKDQKEYAHRMDDDEY